MAGLVAIYALRCQGSLRVRYIGKANDPTRRLKSHMRDSRRRNTPVYCWIRALSVPPEMEILEWVSVEEWPAAERKWIALYREKGGLLNLADGGDAPSITPAQRKKAGVVMNDRLKADPAAQRMRYLKAQLSKFYRDVSKAPLVGEKWRLKLHGLYLKDPSNFACWASLHV